MGCWGSLLVLLGMSAAGWAAGKGDVPRVADNAVVLKGDGGELRVSLRCPKFVFDAGTVGGALPSSIKGGLAKGEVLEGLYAPQAVGSNGQLEVRLRVEWAANEEVLHKWAEFRLTGAPAPLLLKEVVLEEALLPGQKPELEGGGAQSYPGFWRGFFAGIEFPVAATRLEGERVIVGHRPGWRLPNGEWKQSRKAVFGVASAGREREQFARYISARRPKPSGLHVNYNSWWTSPAPFYKESDILKLMEEFERKLYKPYGVSFDTFCIDMGWAEPRSVWQIKKDLFPEGFSRIQSAAARMGASLGLWISPSACYHDALDPDWARTNLETFLPAGVTRPESQMCCLGGPKYATAFRLQLVNLVRQYGIRHVKLDGYCLECPESGHGHAPGVLSSEAVAEGGIAAFEAVRQVQPAVWLESTCFGWNPSPWWLFYVNSVIGTFGDDAPRGRVPAPIYRESYTTGRDYYNLQGAARMPVPIVAQEVLGVIHQTREPFMNDAVITALRGNAFLPLYLNPAYMEEGRWEALAQFLKWSRVNAPLLKETVPFLPVSWRGGKVPHFAENEAMPREPYGYAHGGSGEGLVALRNPWIAPQSVALRLDESVGVEPGMKRIAVVSLYPEPRLYAGGARFGDMVQVPLAPYETLVLALGRRAKVGGLPKASDVVGKGVEVDKTPWEFNRVEFQGEGRALGPDWTSLGPSGSTGLELKLHPDVTVAAPSAELLVLAEAGTPVAEPVEQSLQVDGKEVPLAPSSSETGWSATGQRIKEHWLFLKAPLSRGEHHISLSLLWGDGQLKLSTWVWATKPGGGLPAYPNALPSPETVSLDALAVLGPTDSSEVTGRVQVQRPVEKIDGIFLDALEPVSCTQGWGKLQRNQSVWEKPMTIGSRHFRRGLGTHADSRIVYDIGGRYRRFQCLVGADGASRATITFEVWTDGKKVWESGLMTRESPAQRVDLEVTGAKRLELVVGDGGDGISSDHANWADAKLLR